MTRLRDPQAPFLELAFYAHDRSGADLLAEIYGSLVPQSAIGGGRVFLRRGPGIRAAPYAREDDSEVRTSGGVGAGQLREWLRDPDARVTRVWLDRGTLVVPHSREILAVLPVSERAALGRDNHPVAIWLEGEAFSHPPGSRPQRALQIAARARAKFLELTAVIQPAYAAVTLDYSLECLADLAALQQDAPALRTFYLGRNFVPDPHVSELQGRFPSAWWERGPKGTFATTDPLFASKPLSVSPQDARDLSLAAARVLRGAWRSRKA